MAGIEFWENDLQSVAVVNSADPNLAVSWDGRPALSFGAGFRYQTNKYLGDDDENGFYLGAGSNQLLSSDITDDDTGESIFKRVVQANAHTGYRHDNGTFAMEYSAWAEYSDRAPLLVTARIQGELKEIVWGAVSYGVGNGNTQFQLGVYALRVGNGAIVIGGQGGFSVGSGTAQPGASFDFFGGYRVGL